MKYLKMLGLAAVAAMAFMAFAASSASATTLEVGGVTKNEEVKITASIASGATAKLKDTFGFSVNTCSESHVAGHTTSYTNPVTGPIDSLTFGGCTYTVTVHDPGSLEVVHTSGTNGTVYSEEAELTVDSAFGHLTCTTGETTPIGTLAGVSSGHATMSINAVIACSGIGNGKWEGTYTVTSPTGLGVSA